MIFNWVGETQSELRTADLDPYSTTTWCRLVDQILLVVAFYFICLLLAYAFDQVLVNG